MNNALTIALSKVRIFKETLPLLAAEGIEPQDDPETSRKLILDTDVDVLLRGARVLNDTRIAPGERRVERFRFRALGEGRVTLNAVATYQYAPAILDVQRMNVRLAEAERIIR